MDFMSLVFIAILIGAPIMALMSDGGPKKGELLILVPIVLVVWFFLGSSIMTSGLDQLGSSGGRSPGWFADESGYEYQ